MANFQMLADYFAWMFTTPREWQAKPQIFPRVASSPLKCFYVFMQKFLRLRASLQRASIERPGRIALVQAASHDIGSNRSPEVSD